MTANTKSWLSLSNGATRPKEYQLADDESEAGIEWERQEEQVGTEVFENGWGS